MDRSRILTLYRNILYCAQRFPSIKRKELVDEIRIEFRANKSLTEPVALDLALEKAVRGLSQLQKYTSLRPDAPAWTVELEKDPLGGPPSSQE